MRYSVFLLLAGALLSTLLAPLSIRYARLLGAVDHPDGGRHLHPRPTPRLGGLALLLTALPLSLFIAQSTASSVWLTGGALVAALGVTDDLYPLSPLVKLSALLAVCALPAAFGLAPEVFTLGSLRFSLSHPFDNIFSLLWVLLLVNAFNLIDGADGLCATLASVSLLSLFLTGGNPAALILFGAIIGFLPYNLPLKKRITRSFLGDTGALFLGYSLAVFSLEIPTFSLATPLLFALPLFDLFRVFTLRLLRGKNPFRADRTHLHHRLAERGYSHSAILALCTVYALLFSLLGLALTVFSP